jgi:hypothetical protein
MESEGSLSCSQQAATGPFSEPILSNPHPYILFTYKMKINLMNVLHLRIGLSTDRMPSVFSTTIFMNFSSARGCYMSQPSHCSWFYLRNNIWWIVQLWSYCLFNVFHPPINFFSVGPYGLLSQCLLSNSLSLCSALSLKDQFSHSIKKQVELWFCTGGGSVLNFSSLCW